LLSRTNRVVLAVNEGEEPPNAESLPRTERPIAEESLVMMARALMAPSSPCPAARTCSCSVKTAATWE
jgi:hypothetical protein